RSEPPSSCRTDAAETAPRGVTGIALAGPLGPGRPGGAARGVDDRRRAVRQAGAVAAVDPLAGRAAASDRAASAPRQREAGARTQRSERPGDDRTRRASAGYGAPRRAALRRHRPAEPLTRRA